jgi:hypothetical protein
MWLLGHGAAFIVFVSVVAVTTDWLIETAHRKIISRKDRNNG